MPPRNSSIRERSESVRSPTSLFLRTQSPRDAAESAVMTPKAFRRIALGLEGAYEHQHMGHPDFRAANGRIFASLYEDDKRGTAALTPDEQADFLERAPEVFVPAAGAWGRGGWTTIVLKDADEEMVGEALTLAWHRISVAARAREKGSGIISKKRPAKRASRR
jgi:hypothetical protein